MLMCPCMHAGCPLCRKERREKEAFNQRPTGKQIFLQKKAGSVEEIVGEDDDAQEVDYSQYEREERHSDAEEEEGGIVLSDSD